MIGLRMQYIDLCNLFVEVRDCKLMPIHQLSVQFKSKHTAATCTIEKTNPMGVVPRNPRQNIIWTLRNHYHIRIIGVWLVG